MQGIEIGASRVGNGQDGDLLGGILVRFELTPFEKVCLEIKDNGPVSFGNEFGVGGNES